MSKKEDYQEIVDKLKDDVMFAVERIFGIKPSTEYRKKDFDLLQEAIDKANKYDEKETPKKVKVVKEIDKVVGNIESYRCPTCSYHELFIKFTDINMVGKYKSNYCEVCGQKLDWSDE